MTSREREREINEEKAIRLARNFMAWARRALYNEPAYRSAVVQLSLENPQALSEGVNFTGPDGKYRVKARSDATRDELQVIKHSGELGGWEEMLTIAVEYTQVFRRPGTSPDDERGKANRGVIQYIQYYPVEKYAAETNTAEGIRRAAKFLKENFGTLI